MDSPWQMDRSRLGWWAIALALGVAVAYILYSFVGTFVFGIFVYYGVRPVHRRLERIIRPPTLAAMVSLLAVALPALLLLAYTIAVALQELNNVIETRGIEAAQLQTLLAPYFDISGIVDDPRAILTEPNALELLQTTIQEAGAYVGFFGTAALHLFVMILIAFYLLRDDHRLARWWRNRFNDEQGVMEVFATRVDRDFSHIFFGNLLNAVLTAIIGAISYSLLALVSPPEIPLPYPALLGLLTGVASLVPVVGIKLVYVPVAGYLGYLALADPVLFWFPLVFVAVSFVIVDVIPDLVLRPYVSGRGLHLGLVMLAYIFGPLLFGWYGIFLGPMLLVLLVHFTALVLPELMAGTAIQPEAVGDSPLVREPDTPEPARPEETDGPDTAPGTDSASDTPE